MSDETMSNNKIILVSVFPLHKPLKLSLFKHYRIIEFNPNFHVAKNINGIGESELILVCLDYGRVTGRNSELLEWFRRQEIANYTTVFIYGRSKYRGDLDDAKGLIKIKKLDRELTGKQLMETIEQQVKRDEAKSPESSVTAIAEPLTPGATTRMLAIHHSTIQINLQENLSVIDELEANYSRLRDRMVNSNLAISELAEKLDTASASADALENEFVNLSQLVDVLQKDKQTLFEEKARAEMLMLEAKIKYDQLEKKNQDLVEEARIAREAVVVKRKSLGDIKVSEPTTPPIVQQPQALQTLPTPPSPPAVQLPDTTPAIEMKRIQSQPPPDGHLHSIKIVDNHVQIYKGDTMVKEYPFTDNVSKSRALAAAIAAKRTLG